MEERAIVFLLIMAVLNKTTGQNCTQFLLTEQPPSTLNCNPFRNISSDYIWRLRSSCTVKNIGNTQSFELHWFHRNNNSEVIDLGMPEYHIKSNSTTRVLFGFTNQVYNDSMVGEYWCQIVVFNKQDNTHYHGSGNVITIHPPGYYDDQLRVCNGTVTDTSTVCIDTPYLTTSTVTKASSSHAQHTTVATVTSTKPVSTLSETTPSMTINPFITPLATVSFEEDDSPELSEPSSSIGIITGTVIAIVMLVTACVLLVCMIVIIAISIRKNKLVALERIPINNMKSVIDPSLMDNNPAYRKVTIGQAIEESDHNKGNATTSLNTSAAMTQPPPTQAPIYVNDRTVQWKNEPVYVNTNGRSTISNINDSRINEQPHYENMELLSRSQSGRYESQSTNQNPVTSSNTYYQNVSMMTNHHHYYNTGILRRQNDRVNTTTDHDYANLSPTHKQPSLATKQYNSMETDLAAEYKESHDETNTGSTATLTTNEVM